MGRTASSSKHKSSKKKKSKLSSQTRRKKTSKRNKSKRLHSRDDDSVSCYSDESLRSLSMSSSDSEDGYISRKGRSRVRDKVKSSKKRARRSSSSEDSSVDALRVKMRKRSKRNGDSKVRKKTHKKMKKTRRKASVSSSSSDSEILRTRRHDSPSGTEESEYERKRERGRSRKRKNDKRSLGRTESKKSKLRSRSCSSCSRYSDYSDDVSKDKVVSEIDQSKEIITSEILPRRLKSVITVVQPHYEEEVTGQDKDEHKEEILYDQDDYPSCRSNDSNDGGKRDLSYKSYTKSEDRAKNMVGEEDFASEPVLKDSKLNSRNRIDHLAEIKPQSDGGSKKRPGNENGIDISTTTAGSGSEDLETILRQKALQNLMRFRGPHRNAKPPSHHETEGERNVKSSTAKAEDVENRPSKQELSSGVGESGGRKQHNRRTLSTNSSRLVPPTEEMKLDGRDVEIEYSTAKQEVAHSSSGVEISGNPKDNDYTTVHNLDGKSKSDTSPPMEQALGHSLEQVAPVSAHAAPINVKNKSAAEKPDTVAGSSGNNQNVEVIDACHVAPESSCIKPVSEEHNSKQSQDEFKGNSFEQKTMSVMRGGETVQVSYKVYIPNKAPALARRKLQR